MVSANKPATIYDLLINIKREIEAVSADLCLETVKKLVQRLDVMQKKIAPCIVSSDVLLKK